jgi:hypothetical protein
MASYYVSMVASQTSMSFWVGGSRPDLVAELPWSRIERVHEGVVARGMRSIAAVVLDVRSTREHVVLPLPLSRAGRIQVRPVDTEEAAVIVFSRIGSRRPGRGMQSPR